MMDGEKKIIFKGKGVKIVTNGCIHSCDACIHRRGCKSNTESLIANGFRWHNNTVIYIPSNCPIAIERMDEKVIFT